MNIRSKSRIAWVMGAVLLLSFHLGSSARAQFAPVNKARDLEKSVIEGDEEVRKVKTGQAEVKSTKPEAKSATVKPAVSKKVAPKKTQTPPKTTSAKSATKSSTAKPVAAKPKTAKPVAAKPTTAKPAASKSTAVKPAQTSQKTVVAVTKPAPKKRRQRVRYVKPTPIIVIEAMDRQSLISGISEDGRFVYVRVTPETAFRLGDQTIPATAIVDGMKLDCWGGWEKTAPDIYNAKGVMVKGRLDDYAVRLKINEACQRLSRPHTEIASAPVQPTPTPEATAKTEEKKPDEKKPEEPKPGEPKPGEPKPEEPKPADPNAPPANPEEPKPAEPKPGEPGNP